MTKGMGWECVVKWHRVTKSENNIKRLEIKANIMNNKWAQGKEKWWVMGLKEFVIIINNFFFFKIWHLGIVYGVVKTPIRMLWHA